MIEKIIFYAFSAVLLLGALRVITAKNPVHAVLSLVLTFFTAGALWLFYGAEFLAIALVLVYVGAVMVLFLFVVMLVDINTEKLRQDFVKSMPLAGAVGATILVEMLVILARVASAPMPATAGGKMTREAVNPQNLSNTKNLGEVIFTDYVIAFEFAGMILLVAMVSAIAITLDKAKKSKRQVPGDQVQVKRNDRIRIVSMGAEEHY